MNDDEVRNLAASILEEDGRPLLTQVLYGRLLARGNLDDRQQRDWEMILLTDLKKRFATIAGTTRWTVVNA
jgi:hypothetical protein